MPHRRPFVAAAAATVAVLVPAVPADAAKRVFGSRALQQGMRGRDVRVLQDFLTRVGVRTAVDGQFGPATRGRVREWERRSVIPVDGRVSTDDARRLRRQVESGQTLSSGGSATPLGDRETGAAEDTGAGGPVEAATLAPDGTAIAPASAPAAVKAIIAAGNEIHDKPYKYGGGHGRWVDSGYDCSGSMSYAFHGAGLLDEALDSTGFMSWGEPGPGQWVTIYANSGHSYMVIAGLRFDTSGRAGRESRWTTDMRSSSGYTVRHPAGL